MNLTPMFPKRHRNRLSTYNYSFPGAYFVTICTQNRQHLFGHILDGNMSLNAVGNHATTLWVETIESFENAAVGPHIVMPDHVHGIVKITQSHTIELEGRPITAESYRYDMLLPRIICKYKTVSAKTINLIQSQPGRKVWQRNYWERIIRTEDEYCRVSQYIEDNPRNWQSGVYKKSREPWALEDAGAQPWGNPTVN